MSKFDKYGVGTSLLPTSNGATVSTNVAAELARVAEAAAIGSERAKSILQGRVARVAVLLDATGSMAGLLRTAKTAIAEIVTRATAEAEQQIEIELFVYRDYDVAQNLVERSGSSSEPQRLISWLERIEPMGGGANDGEAVEAALDLVVQDQGFAVVLLAGDEPSNSQNSLAAAGRRNALTASALAAKLGRAKVAIHSFVIGSDTRTVADFSQLSNLSGGKSGRLDGSQEMVDLAVMAILAALKGASGVQSYVERTSLSANSQEFAQLLLGSR